MENARRQSGGFVLCYHHRSSSRGAISDPLERYDAGEEGDDKYVFSSVGEDRRLFLEGIKVVARKKSVEVKCPCCGLRLFDLEPEPEMGNEVIKIKCHRCRGVAAIKLKNCFPVR